jgi:hypothetical protein
MIADTSPISFPPSVNPGLAGWYHLIFFGLFLPFVVVRRRNVLQNSNIALTNRSRHFRVTAITLLFFGGLSLMVARVEGMEILTWTQPSAFAVLAAIGFYVGAVVLMRPVWRRAVERRSRVVYFLMPQNPSEKVWWAVVSLLAGVTEEITWRGVQFSLLRGLTGGLWAAALLSSISFGLGHSIQGWKSVGIIVVFGLLAQGLVGLSSSLYLIMAVHAAYDLTAGFTYARLGRELGFTLEDAKSVS